MMRPTLTGSLLLTAAIGVALILPCLAGEERSESSLAPERSTLNPEHSDLVPLPREVPAPRENPTTPEKVALGRKLFFDPRLSGDNSMSCATCHDPEKAFGDGLPRAKGTGGKELARNTPTVLNVGFFERLFWDGRAASLEEQALEPIRSPDEMNQDLDQLERELNALPEYAEPFREVFGTPVTREGIARALAAYQRTLVTGPSPFDHYLAGDEEALSEAARRGMELFVGEAGCVRCHHGPLLSDGKFYRLGVASRDEGRAAVTGDREDTGKFRTPSLRNVAQTGPYMHNGSMKTLEEVVQFYYRNVPRTTPGGFRPDVQALSGQSFTEIPDVVAFLESLTGEWEEREKGAEEPGEEERGRTKP
jgi:cytochrome c peroxidase